MTRIAIIAACFALSGCAGLTAPPRAPEQRQEDRATLELLLRYCDLTANVDMDLGLSARTGLGLKAGGTCRADRAPEVVPLSRLGDPPA